MMSDYHKQILDEQKFPYENMSLEERNYFINILSNCKDICDSKYKVDNYSECEIVQLSLKKDGDVINANGFLCIGKNNIENRCIDANIYLNSNDILVEMQITRITSEDIVEYTVFDKFTIENDILKRISKYENNEYSDIIENEEMKGKLK